MQEEKKTKELLKERKKGENTGIESSEKAPFLPAIIIGTARGKVGVKFMDLFTIIWEQRRIRINVFVARKIIFFSRRSQSQLYWQPLPRRRNFVIEPNSSSSSVIYFLFQQRNRRPDPGIPFLLFSPFFCHWQYLITAHFLSYLLPAFAAAASA